jgi:hypothetical protein
LILLKRSAKGENFVAIKRDDDVDTDQDVLKAGIRACHRDLLNLKTAL